MMRRHDRYKRRFKLLNQFRPVTMVASTIPGTHNPRISAQTAATRLREIGEIPPNTMYVLYATFLFWPRIFVLPHTCVINNLKKKLFITKIDITCTADLFC